MTEDDFQKLADSWLRVVTVFLALQLATITFVLTQFHDNHELTKMMLYLSIAMASSMISALALFLGARDPRLKNYPRDKIIDIGVTCTAGSCVITAVMGGFIAYLFVSDVILSVIITLGLISAMCIFYPFLYFKYLRIKT